MMNVDVQPSVRQVLVPFRGEGSGIAIVGNTSLPEQGAWFWSADGIVWTPVPRAASETKAVVLRGASRLWFDPSDGFQGKPSGGLEVVVTDTVALVSDGNADITTVRDLFSSQTILVETYVDDGTRTTRPIGLPPAR